MGKFYLSFGPEINWTNISEILYDVEVRLESSICNLKK